MNQALKDTICVRCRMALGDYRAGATEIVCPGCGQRYPVIKGRIPILVADPRKYLAEIYVQYKRFLRSERDNLTKVSEQQRENGLRTAGDDRVQVAMRSNARSVECIVEAIQEEVNQHVSVEDILDVVDSHPTIGYSTMLDYLLRDWCRLPEGEAELEVIRAALLRGINAASAGEGTALVIGAGAGRTAWDLCDVYERVWAIDKSFTMAHHFYSLLADGTVPFYELNSRNIFDRADSTTLHRATLALPRVDGDGQRDFRNEFSYFVADALNVPAPDGSFSAIFSVYFTDLVPLELYIREITRLLKTGGVFVHFGPLEYHFDDVNHLLAADEVRSVFASHGFDVRFEERIHSTHLSSGRSMVSKVYNNWAFVAVKKAENCPAAGELMHDSVLAIAGTVRYQLKGTISALAGDVWEATITCPTRERFTGAGSVLSILRLVDGARTVGQILELLGREYDVRTDASREAIVDAIGKLREHGVLKVVER